MKDVQDGRIGKGFDGKVFFESLDGAKCGIEGVAGVTDTRFIIDMKRGAKRFDDIRQNRGQSFFLKPADMGMVGKSLEKMGQFIIIRGENDVNSQVMEGIYPA
jgi:hypothetical protein